MNLASVCIRSITIYIKQYICISTYKILPEKCRALMLKPKYISMSQNSAIKSSFLNTLLFVNYRVIYGWVHVCAHVYIYTYVGLVSELDLSR